MTFEHSNLKEVQKLIPLLLWLSVGVTVLGTAPVVKPRRAPVHLVAAHRLGPRPQTVTLAWDRNPDPTVSFYNLYWGPARGFYTGVVMRIFSTNQTLTNLGTGVFHFAATDSDTNGVESAYSTEALWTNVPPPPVSNFLLSVQILQSTDFTNWTTFTNLGQFQATNSGSPVYWRSLINIQPQ